MADIEAIQEHFARRDYLFTAHASDRAVQRGIRSVDIEQAVASADVIEDYPDDKYGPSCLLLGYTGRRRPLHVQVSYPPGIKIITVYEPSPDEWEEDLRTRKTP